MADKRISELDAITGSATAATDVFVVVDTSTGQTKKITREELNNAIEQDVLSTVDINGGTIDGTIIGGTTPAAGTFTTLTASGDLTVDTNTLHVDSTNNRVGIGTSSPANKLEVSGAVVALGAATAYTNTGLYIQNKGSSVFDVGAWRSGASAAELTFSTDSGSDAAPTERMRIDSSGRVGIGASAPSANLTVTNGASGGTLSIGDNAAGSTAVRYLQFGESNDYSIQSNANSYMRFYTEGTERLRIDSSGNVLVGGTTAFGTGTTTINSSGLVYASRASNKAGHFNRETADGDIVVFSKDGTTVGSIGVDYSSRLYIGTGGTGLFFNDLSDAVQPISPAGDLRGNAIGLGTAGTTFKDLYLGGGVYLGGTTTENKLDDYEEGNWTPTFGRTGTAFTPTPTYTGRQGRYIKVGNLVHATCYIRFSNDFSGGSGNYKVDGLPFTAGSQLQGIAHGITSVFVGDLNHNQGNYVSGTTVIYSSNNVLNNAPVNDYLTFTVTYEAT